MKPLKSIAVQLEVGQEIEVGPNKKRARITKIEFHEKSGEININTTQGPRRALTFKLCEDRGKNSSASSSPADRYR
jgi:hypothetical protein